MGREKSVGIIFELFFWGGDLRATFFMLSLSTGESVVRATSRVGTFGGLFTSCRKLFIHFTGACLRSRTTTRSVTIRKVVCC